MAVNGSSSGGSGGAGSIRAGRAFVELATKDDGLRAGLDAARQRVVDLGKQLASPMLRPTLNDFAKLDLQSDNLNKRIGVEQLRAKLSQPMLRPMLREIAQTEKAAAKLQKQFAFEQLRASVGPVRAHLQTIGAKLKEIGAATAKVGLGFLGAGAAMVAPFAGAFKGILDRSTEISKLAIKLGVATEQLSEFAYAAETTGQTFQDLEGHFENLAERVAQGALGAGEAADTFKKLGIDAAQLKLQNPVDQLITLAKAMQNVTNETDRLGMLSSLGGDKFQGLNALFKKGPEGIRQLMAEAKTVGASVSTEGAANAIKVEAAFHRAWTAIKNTFLSIGEAFLPFVDHIEAASRWLISISKTVRTFIQNNQALVAIIAGVGAAIAGVGAAILVAGGFVAVFSAALSALAPIAAAVFSPVGLTVAGVALAVTGLIAVVAMATVGFLKFTETGKALVRIFSEAFGSIGATFRETFGGISDALKKGDMSLALSIAGKGMRIVWNELILALKKSWSEFLDWMAEKSPWGMVGNIGSGTSKLLGLDDLAKKITGVKDFGKRSLIEALGFDLEEDNKHLENLKRQLKQLTAMAKPKLADIEARPLSEYSHGNFKDYIPKVTAQIKGLFQAPNLNQALGYGDNVKVSTATIQTAANTKVIANEIKRLEPKTFT